MKVLDERLYKLWSLKQRLSLVWRLKKTGSSRIFLWRENLLFLKCKKFLIDLFQCLYIPHENRRYRKGPVKFNVLNVWKKLCLNKAKSWFEFNTRFGRYSWKSLHRVLFSFISSLFYLYLIFRESNCVTMTKMSSLTLLMESYTNCLRILIFFSF